MKARAFTLLELLVAVAIISLLLALVLPSLGQANRLAKRTICMGNLRNIGMGMSCYAEDNNDVLPFVGQVRWGDPASMPKSPEQMLLPYIASVLPRCTEAHTGRVDWYVWKQGSGRPWPQDWGDEHQLIGASYTWSEQAVCGLYYDAPGCEVWKPVKMSRAECPGQWAVYACGNSHIFNAWFWASLAADCPEEWNPRQGQWHVGGDKGSVNILFGDLQTVRTVERTVVRLREVRSSPVGKDPYPDGR
jgi:prepilin-type N-terminal cleavage/methylation domain-containing protein